MTSHPIRRPIAWTSLLAIALVGILLWRTPLLGAEAPVLIPPPSVDTPKVAGPLQTAVLAGGCFWGVQGVFEHARGVTQVVAGYAGGDPSTAQYETVSTGTTGHAESVRITFDPAIISYGELLHIAFSVVYDPTQLNAQGPDVGPQYRSVIFYADESQRRIAEAYIKQLDAAHAFRKPIVTRVDAFKGFYPAERYHQDYLVNHPGAAYIAYNDLPKVDNFRRIFPNTYADKPVLVGNQTLLSEQH